MSYQLSFSLRHHFNTTEIGITIPVRLMRNNLVALCNAKIDTGSDYCFFQYELAEELGIEVESGALVTIGTLAGKLTTYAHTIELYTLGIAFESTVLFAANPGAPRNILGRVGWLENIHLALTMDDEMIHLSPAFIE